MPLELLVEIGTEEIPAGFLARAIVDLGALIEKRLADARLEHGGVKVLGTPRRLALIVNCLADAQPDISERVVGPPARVAFDADGKPTKAAAGFAERNGVDVSALERTEVEGKKGEYVVCTRQEAGRPAREVLGEQLADWLSALPWPKSMRWGGGEETFVRPVHWLVALLGGEVLGVSFARVAAGRETRGHRFLAPQPIALDGTESDYVSKLRAAHVVVDPAARRTMIDAELARVESESGCSVRPDPDLLAEVANLVEYPAAVCGEFDRAFLEVPEEVIVSAMRSHQRYFAMQDASGALANRFATIAGTITRDLDVVRHGNERVLAARLADAAFFFREDQKHSIDAWAAKLDGVVFQSKLGTIGAKVGRIVANAAWIAAEVGGNAHAARAAALCKADLVTHMVGEFPELQGVMGRHYARIGGEADGVALAIEEHYLPRGARDRLPTEDAGAIVGLADRIDTIVGCFAAGLAPTGSADPYGLRRAALAVLAILLDRDWTLSLDELIDTARGQLDGTVEVSDEVTGKVREFFRTRLKGALQDTGAEELPVDCVEAALAAGYANVPDARARALAVARLRSRQDFEPLASAFKRVANILKGASATNEPDPAVFVEDDERTLWSSFSQIRSRVDSHLGDGDYNAALQVLTELKEPVDKFFDSVLVMDENADVRANRLAMLGRINATFNRIADFRQLAV